MKNTWLLIKQTFKSLAKSKFSIFLLTFFLIICFWLILGFTFLYTTLHSSVQTLRKDSNLSSAVLSTKTQGEPKISYTNINAAKDYKQGSEVKTLNPQKQDPYTLNSSDKNINPAIESIKKYYQSKNINPDYFNNVWAYVSTPGEWNPTINSSNFKTYTSLLMGDNNHYITLNKSFANVFNKTKIKNYVDIWTLYKNGLPLNNSQDEWITNPLNLIVDSNKNIIVGQSEFDKARVEGININPSFSVSHVLFDIQNNVPVYSTDIVPSQNNITVNNNSDTYISSPGSLPNINTDPDDWKIVNNNQPNWSLATPTIKGWSVNALYGRIYKSIARTPDMLISYPSRIYQPQLNVSKLSNTQKIICSLINVNSISDKTLKNDLEQYINQFKDNKTFNEFLTNLQGILEPKITILQPYYKDDKQASFIINNTLNQLSNYFTKIEDLALDPISFLNTQPIKLIDIINKYTSVNSISQSLNINLETTKFRSIQTLYKNQSYNIIAVNKNKNATINKIVSKDNSKLYLDYKTYDYQQITNSFRKYLTFCNNYGWKTKKFDSDYKANQAKVQKELLDLQPDFKVIAWLLNEADFLGQYKNLHSTIQYLQQASQDENIDNLVEDFKQAMSSLMFTSITFNNGTLEMSFKVPGRLSDWSDATPINAKYINNNYALSLVNSSWLLANKNDKKVIDSNQLNKLMQLPYKDFQTALNKLDDKYKINVNGLNYLIVGTGDSADFAYPITNQYSFNKKSNVVIYLNNLGYQEVANVDSNKENVWAGINSQQNFPLDLSTINKTLSPYFNNQKFYMYNDSNMPNKIMYQSINYPSELSNRILLISLIVGILSAILCITVLFIILNHIIKSNIVWIGLAISNGERKIKFIFINWATSLTLALIVGLIAGIIISWTYPLLSFFIYDQWTIPIHLYEVFWIIPVLIVSLFILIYFGSILISLVILKPRLLNLINNSNNKTKKIWNVTLTKKINLVTLMNRFIMSKFLKISGVLVIGLIISFLASSAIIVNNQLNASYRTSVKNTQYNYAIDLYSPTIQGGGYIINEFENIPDSINKTELQIYEPGGTYANKIDLVTNPYTKEPMTNMWLPDSNSLVSELQNNLQFLKDKLVNQLALNISIPYNNNIINLWDNAVGIFPAPVVNYINENTNNLLSTAKAFYQALDKDNQLKQDYYQEMLTNKPQDLTDNPWTFNGKAIDDNNPDNNMWNQNNDGTWEWTTSGENSVVVNSLLGGKYLSDRAIRLITYLVTNWQNPVFVKWCNQNHLVVEKPYWLGLNQLTIPSIKLEDNLVNGTYTYLEVNNNNRSIKIDGINPQSSFIQLHDSKNSSKIINNLLSKNEIDITKISDVEIPMIINEVAAKLDNTKVGDIYEFTIQNNLNRFTWKFNNVKNPFSNVKFKVVGINNSKLRPEYWINQSIANQLLSYNQLPINQQFNGVYYSDSQPIALTHLSSLYSPSGISTLSSSFPTTYNEMDESILRNPLVNSIFNIDPTTHNNILDSITKINLVAKILSQTNNAVNYGGQTQIALNAVKELNQIFGPTLINNSINSANVTYLSHEFANIIDNTISNFSIVFIVAILPILLCIDLLLISTIIEDINAIFGLLLTQGYSKKKLIGYFGLLTLIWTTIGIILGASLSLIIPNIFNSIIWMNLNVITNASFNWINLLISIASFVVIAIITLVYGYWKLNKTSLLTLISEYQIA